MLCEDSRFKQESNLIMNRDEIIRRVRQREIPWDIIVIGGGATGVGCSLDAASRRLDVLLVEQHDFGKGTSSRSTKLVHGGVRYLAQGNISLVREALKERGILLRNAPHVVHKQAFIVPCYSLWQKFYYGLGLKVYDLLSGKYSFGRSRLLSKSETIEHLKTVKTGGLRGGVLYYDGQFDDTRLLIDMVKTAHGFGASVLNYAKVTGLQKSGNGRVSGLEFVDQLTGETFTAKCKVLINATGAFCDSVRAMANTASEPIVTLSQGIHLVLDQKFLPGDTAIMIPKTSDGRVLFCIPWHGHTLVGTTDTPVGRADLEPRAMENEIEFVLDTAAKYLTQSPTRDDVLSIFVGIRPLQRTGTSVKTSALSRGHFIESNAPGMITITGGKWTTYRRMAEDTVDVAMKNAGLHPKRSTTREIAIVPSPARNRERELLHPKLPYTTDDVVTAVRNEMAQTLEDVLGRRTRALFLDAAASVEMAERTAEIMARELRKNEEWQTSQIDDFKLVAENYLV